ncbi:MAG: helix-turn-helix domain-containing protein [Anaerolineae bacterium]
MTDLLLPAIITTPGEVLKAELDARDLSQSDLALIINRPEQMISEIINARKQITAETAHDFEQALDIPATFWLSLEANYQLHLVQQQEHDQAKARRARLLTLLPVRQLIKRGWVKLPERALDLEGVVEQYLGMNPLDQQPILAASFRHSTVKEPHTLAALAWIKRVEHLAHQACTPSFDKAALSARVPELLACAAQADDLASIPPILASCGVYLTVVPHLDKTYLDGAALVRDGKGVIALTLRYDRIDSFWFTLLHEVAHLLEGNSHGYLDTLRSPGKEDANEAPVTLNEEEKAANRLARNWLIPAEALDDFIEEVAPHYDQERIEAFARAIGRHPGIVLGRLMRDGVVKYSQLRGLLVKVSPYLGGQIAA